MRSHSTGTDLREQAMEALHESTTMLQVAGKLLDQGNVEEARRLRDEARAQRNVSVWLMAKANTLEQEFDHSAHAPYHHREHSTAH
jgi:hypothetical protein